MEKDLPWVRCSSLPSFFECAGVAIKAEHPINHQSEAANFGHACHKVMELHIEGRGPDMQAIADRYGVDRYDLGDAVAAAIEMWAEVSMNFPHPETEVRLRAGFTGGTADVVHHDGKTAAIGDWKFGMTLRESRYQVMGYVAGLVAELGWPASREVDAFIAYPRIDTLHTYTVTQDDLAEFRQRFADQARFVGRQFAPGAACRWCERKHECEARRKFMQSAVSSFLQMSIDHDDMEHSLRLLYGKVITVEEAVKEFRAALKMHLEDQEELELDDQSVLYLSSRTKTSLDARKAWPILQAAGLTADDMSQVVSISKSKAMKKVREKAKKNKKQAEETVMDELQDADALTVSTYTALAKKTKR